MAKKRVKEVKKVTDISMEYIVNFMERASDDEADELMKMAEKFKKEEAEAIRQEHSDLTGDEVDAKANRQYFGAFRADFARRFRPELLAVVKPKERKDALTLAYERRRTKNAVAGA